MGIDIGFGRWGNSTANGKGVARVTAAAADAWRIPRAAPEKEGQCHPAAAVGVGG